MWYGRQGYYLIASTRIYIYIEGETNSIMREKTAPKLHTLRMTLPLHRFAKIRARVRVRVRARVGLGR